ncbi:MAG: hypothetical protein DSY40_01665 [Nautilia sp.]|nr:MAG: hypothetical protein DSY40_01665 [Nautilia sp.]
MKIIFLILPIFLLSDDSFITNLEYGEMLYKNPRGIGCIKCHGKNGKGKVIAIYLDDKTGRKKKLIAPNIKNINYKTFYYRIKKLKILKKGKWRKIYYSIMPKYNYLVDEEIKAIYNYLHKKDNK